MRKLREILRLKYAVGRTHREIAKAKQPLPTLPESLERVTTVDVKGEEQKLHPAGP